MSSAAEIYTIVAALEKAEIEMSLKKGWISNNEEQKRFLNYLKDCRESKISEIDVEVSSNSDIINNFLEKKGFSIRLQPFPPNTLGFASVLDLLVEWLNPGEKVKIKAKNEDIYEGVRLKKEGVSFFKSMVKGYLYNIAGLHTKSGDTVYMTIPKNPIAGLDLIEIVDTISNNMEVLAGVYDGIRFPMVDLDLVNNLEWLKGMLNFNGKIPVEITQAIQQIKIKMNDKGARFKSGTAIAITLMAIMSPKPDMMIDEPFLLWVEKHDLKEPLMAAFITEESWKNPENL